MSWHRKMLNIQFINWHQQNSLPRVLLVQTKFWMSFNKPTDCGSILTFIPIGQHFQENAHKSLWFLIHLWPWIKVKVIHTDIKIQSFAVSIITPSLKEMILLASECKQSLNIFLQNHAISVLSFKSWTDEIKWVWGSSNQQVSSTAYQIPSKLIEILWDNWRRCCLLSRTPVTLDQHQHQLD